MPNKIEAMSDQNQIRNVKVIKNAQNSEEKLGGLNIRAEDEKIVSGVNFDKIIPTVGVEIRRDNETKTETKRGSLNYINQFGRMSMKEYEMLRAHYTKRNAECGRSMYNIGFYERQLEDEKGKNVIHLKGHDDNIGSGCGECYKSNEKSSNDDYKNYNSYKSCNSYNNFNNNNSYNSYNNKINNTNKYHSSDGSNNRENENKGKIYDHSTKRSSFNWNDLENLNESGGVLYEKSSGGRKENSVLNENLFKKKSYAQTKRHKNNGSKIVINAQDINTFNKKLINNKHWGMM